MDKLNTSAGLQGYNAVSSTPRVQSPVEKQVECLEREVGNLDMLSQQLYTRLGSVMKQAEENISDNKDRMTMSALPEAIYKNTENIKVIALRVMDILERLEL